MDPDFTQMVKRVWPDLMPSAVDDDMGLLSHKLRLLKSEVKSWIKQKVADMEKESHSLDDEISALISSSSLGILSHEDQLTSNILTSKKKVFLEHYLLTWQLKSRAKWAVLGDSNTKYFHALASGHRNQNAI